MFSLWFVRPKATYPYPEKVVVEYEGVERVQMSLFRELPRQSLERSGGAVTVAGDITRSANACQPSRHYSCSLRLPRTRSRRSVRRRFVAKRPASGAHE